MIDTNRDKYMHLMEQVEELEEQVDAAEKALAACRAKNIADKIAAAEEGLRLQQALLAEKRNELIRVSDGCGRPHPQS